MKHPHVIQYPNISNSIFVKFNGTLLKKQKHLLQISVRELHSDLILPVSQGRFCGARNSDVRVCIGDMYLRKYMPKYVKQMSNRNNITCGCKTCISAILLSSDLNKWRSTQLVKLDKLYINATSDVLC